MREGSSPISISAHSCTVSREPPSPIPVMPASVSTVTTWKLWLNIGREMGDSQMRTRVIFIFGMAA
jgi:hypothetical protein